MNMPSLSTMTWRLGHHRLLPETLKLAHWLRCKTLQAPAGLAGRVRLFAAGCVLIRDASALLFEPDVCGLSRGQTTGRVQSAPGSRHRQGHRCTAPASAQPSQTRRGLKRRFYREPQRQRVKRQSAYLPHLHSKNIHKKTPLSQRKAGPRL